MTTQWIWRTDVIVPVADAERIREIGREIDPDPASTGGFSIRLSATGEEPATHVAGGWPMTEAMRQQAEAVLADWQGYGLSECPRFWRVDALTELLTSSNVSEAGGAWSFDDSLAAAGLQVIRPEVEGP